MKAPTNHIEFQERLERILREEFPDANIANQDSMTKTSWWCQTLVNWPSGKQFELEIHMFPDDVENHPGRFTTPAPWVAEMDPEGARQAKEIQNIERVENVRN